MCKIHRKEETKHKDKKLCYGKIRSIISDNEEKFYLIKLHSKYLNNLYESDITSLLLSMIKENIDNINKFNVFFTSISQNENENRNSNNNLFQNTNNNINLGNELILNTNTNNKNEDIKFIQNKLKEFCILNKPTSLKECRDYINLNYKAYKEYIIKNPNIIKNIYYRYTNHYSTLDLNMLLSNSKTTDDNPYFRELIYFNGNTCNNNSIRIGIIYATSKNINRLAAEHWYIDGTFIHPPKLDKYY